MTRTLTILCALTAACTPGGSPPGLDDTGTAAAVDGVVVVVPDGAFDGELEVTVTLADAAALPSPGDLASAVYEIGPSPTTFDLPVTVGLPIDAATPLGSAIDMVVFDAASGAWEILPSLGIVEGVAFATTTHFSPFALLINPVPDGCDALWDGGPGSVAPLLTPTYVVVSDATRVDDVVAYSGATPMELGSTWVTSSCTVTVSGFMGEGVAGPGAWTDWNTGETGSIAQSNGVFSVDLAVGPGHGPQFGLADACQAPNGHYPYNLTIEAAADCVDLCAGVTCGADDGNACTADTCNPTTGQCEQAPAGGGCGDTGAGQCVQGMCMMEVVMDGTVDGNDVCASQGLTCVDVPTLDPVEEACLAFHPTATVSSDASGWSQSVYCDDNEGPACAGRVDDCHHCPACNPGMSCTQLGSDFAESIYVSCAP